MNDTITIKGYKKGEHTDPVPYYFFLDKKELSKGGYKFNEKDSLNRYYYLFTYSYKTNISEEIFKESIYITQEEYTRFKDFIKSNV